jgi:hypothetical protein
MQATQKTSEQSNSTDADYDRVVFFSEKEIAGNIGDHDWVMPCGHDC